MNIRNHLIEVQCSQRDVSDVAQVLIHSLIFFRTHGKFNYKHEGSYSIGTLGFERATCDHLDLTYIRCASSSLINCVKSKIQEFLDRLNEASQSGTITLELFTRRPNRWPFNDSKIVWEVWNIKIVIASSNPALTSMLGEHQHYQARFVDPSACRLEDVLSQKIFDIIRIVNSDKCSLPPMPTQHNLDTVFDTSHAELQPYLYSLSYKINEYLSGPHPSSFGSSMKFSEGGVLTDSSTQSSLRKFLLGALEL